MLNEELFDSISFRFSDFVQFAGRCEVALGEIGFIEMVKLFVPIDSVPPQSLPVNAHPFCCATVPHSMNGNPHSQLRIFLLAFFSFAKFERALVADDNEICAD